MTSVARWVADHGVDRQVACSRSLLVVHPDGPGSPEVPIDGDVEAGPPRSSVTAFGPVECPLRTANVEPMGLSGRDIPVLRTPHPHVHLARMARRARLDPSLDQDAVRRGVLESQIPFGP